MHYPLPKFGCKLLKIGSWIRNKFAHYQNFEKIKHLFQEKTRAHLTLATFNKYYIMVA